jgi:hypothetical protein
MRFEEHLRIPVVFALVLSGCLIPASAQTESLLYGFQDGTDGAQPVASLIADKAGNLFGTTLGGGPLAYGTAYELTPPASLGGSWTETVLYTFQGGSDGAYPYSSLVFDEAGNLYGTTTGGGDPTCFCGVVFKLAHSKSGSWTERTLYSFTGNDGASPFKGLIFDDEGDLFGATYAGGSSNAGAVFELMPPSGNSAGPWREKVLYSFTGGSDGGFPISDLVRDKGGKLYGTTLQGGALGYGAVFQLTRPSGRGVSWTEAAIYSFTGGSDGADPYDGVTLDAHGRLVGVATFGGNLNCGNGCGTVYQLTPPATPGGAWSENTLYQFTGGNDGAQPFAKPVLDNKGKLFGTASFDGPANAACSPFCGNVYELTPPASGTSSWAETNLYGFTGANDGYYPSASLFLGKRGVLYGTTAAGGASGVGIAFQIAP